MSVHIHELLSFGVHGEKLSPDVLNWLSQTVAFDMGVNSKFDNSISIIPDLARLPYETCWFEASTDPEEWDLVFRIGILAKQIEDKIHMFFFIRVPEDMVKVYGGTTWKAAGGCVCSGGAVIANSSTLGESWDHPAILVLKFISALNCTNVRRVEHAPSPRLQKARIKRGKVPLFSYWTLDLDLGCASDKAPYRGGTHASPRVHLRRGHPRQYAPGLWTWVQPHAVGNKSLGMVHKDYAVKPAEKWGQQ